MHKSQSQEYRFHLHQVQEELSQQLAPRRHLERMTPKTNENGTLVPIIQAAPVYLQHYSEDTCPQCADYTGDKGYKLDDVKRGIVSMDHLCSSQPGYQSM